MNSRDLPAFCTLFKPHPWHGVDIGTDAPWVVTCYIEVVPTDHVKFEMDRKSGYLKVDRPQQFSNVCPTLYGFIPRTLCGMKVAKRWEFEGQEVLAGDEDPMDICVFSDSSFPRGDFLLDAIPIGGLRMLDRGVADDKIIGVLKGDAVFGKWQDVRDCPPELIERLRHYFLTYKHSPDEDRAQVIVSVYGRDEAVTVIQKSQEDYREQFGQLTDAVGRLAGGH